MLKISLLHAPDHSILTSKIEKSPYPGRGTPPSQTLPPLGSFAPSHLSLFHSVPPNALIHGTPLPQPHYVNFATTFFSRSEKKKKKNHVEVPPPPPPRSGLATQHRDIPPPPPPNQTPWRHHWPRMNPCRIFATWLRNHYNLFQED